MIDSLIETPVRYFDENPPGRILNRFTSDANIIDNIMIIYLSTSIALSFQLVNFLIFITIINIWMLIPSLILLFILIKWLKYNI